MNADRKGCVIALGVFAALLLLTFPQSFQSDRVLLTQDDSFGLMDVWKAKLPDAWVANWSPLRLVGYDEGSPTFQPRSILLWLLPSRIFVNWLYAFDTFLAASFLFLFLRLKRLSVLASMCGALACSFAGTNFSLVYSGHAGKFGCLTYFAATLWALEHALQRPRAWSWRILAGALLGLTVAEQPDPAILYVGLFTAYLAFRYWLKRDGSGKQAAAHFVLMLAVCALISGLVSYQVLRAQLRSSVQGVAALSESDPVQKWDFATQWSFPPEEILELIAPGFFGWRMDHPQGPYWGREGQTPGLETKREGFVRFKFDTNFIGAVPIFLSIAIVVVALRRTTRGELEPSVRAETIFWMAAALVCLLLALGRYFPLYRLAHVMPILNLTRNPIKFLHLFSVAIGVLSAYGFHYLLEQRLRSGQLRPFWLATGLLCVAAFMGVCYVFGSHATLAAGFRPEFGAVSASIVSRMWQSLLRLAFTSGVLAAILFRLDKDTSEFVRKRLLVLVLVVVTMDLYLTNRHYVEYLPFHATYDANHLVQFLKADPEPERVKVLARNRAEPISGLYNLWLTIYFPYHRIETLDITQMPRMPGDYAEYFRVLDMESPRQWQLSNCRYLVGPLRYWQRIEKDPVLGPHCTLAYAYNVSVQNDQLATAPASPGEFNENVTQVVIRYNAALPRMKFYDRWLVIPDDKQCLQKLSATDFDPQAEVIVSESIPAQTNALPVGTVEKMEWLHRTDNVAQVRVTTDRPGILLFNEKHDPNFLVTVDGQPAQLLRCNFIMKGVQVGPGTHEVRFEYRPPRIGFYVSLAGWIGCLIAVPILRIWEKRGK